MNEKQKEIARLKTKYGLADAEALQMWEEDNDIVINDEIENLTAKAKENVKRYEQGEKPRKKPNKERKIDLDKKKLLDIVAEVLEEVVEITARKTETEICFNFNNETYTLKLTKHRKK